MLLQKITEKELEFMEAWHNPVCLLECVFPDFDNLSKFTENDFGSLRLAQYAMISLESIVDFDGIAKKYNLKEKQVFQLKKNVADLFCYGARKFGKTMCVEKLDLALWLMYAESESGAFGSVDLIHITAVLDAIKDAFSTHPIFSAFKKRVTGAPDFKFRTKRGTTCTSVNFALGSKEPGRQWYGKHVKRVYIEEASMETEDVYKKRKDALSELGAVFRISGMTNFTKHSPAGKVFYDKEQRAKILNYPQYVNPLWDEEEKEDRRKEYGGLDSPGYRIFVGGEVIEDGMSEFDMERIEKACYQNSQDIKRFEIKKSAYSHFKNLITVVRPKNAERIFISADIGESAGTDIVIHSKIGEKYHYLYNITLYNLTHLEQTEILKWLIKELTADVIALDCGDGTGRAIYAELETTISKDKLVWYDGSKNIDVGFETDSEGKVQIKNGKPIVRQEKMKDWSVRRLKILLYGGYCMIPKDYKLDAQLNSVISTKSGDRIIYACISETGDHLFDAWRIFAIAQWLKVDFQDNTPQTKEWGIGTF